jgi:Uma2 family endonuclease
MAALLTDRDAFTLEEMAAQYGGFELQRPLTKSEFVALAERHPDLAMEREPDGTTTLMSPVKRGSGKREFKLSGLFFMWHFQTQLGEFFSPSTGFDLPSGAIKSPDVAWISDERLASSPDEEDRFVQIVPDFVAEVRSATDRLKKLQKKMTDTWMANGVRLAWLIDPYEEKAYIYRQGQSEPEEVSGGFAGNKLFGEAVLPGFELPLETMLRKG